MDLKAFREKIDAVDQRLVETLIQRMDLSKEIARFKAKGGLPVRDIGRESQLISDRTAAIGDPVMKGALEDVLEAVLKASRTIQEDIRRKDIR